MERHLSTGVATIVALMAAHRAASGREEPPVASCQDEIARIGAYLIEDQPGNAGRSTPAIRAEVRTTAGCPS
jgi:hypothetical protein